MYVARSLIFCVASSLVPIPVTPHNNSTGRRYFGRRTRPAFDTARECSSPEKQPWPSLKARLEPKRIVDVIFALTKIHRHIQEHRIEEARAGIGQLNELIGFPFPIELDELIEKPWHQLNVDLSQMVPIWGGLSLQEGDLLFMATDGLDEQVSGCSLQQVEAVLAKESCLNEKAETLLKKCTGKKGGNDNLMFLIAQL